MYKSATRGTQCKSYFYFRKIYKKRQLVNYFCGGGGGVEGTRHKLDYKKFEKQVLKNYINEFSGHDNCPKVNFNNQFEIFWDRI